MLSLSSFFDIQAPTGNFRFPMAMSLDLFIIASGLLAAAFGCHNPGCYGSYCSSYYSPYHRAFAANTHQSAQNKPVDSAMVREQLDGAGGILPGLSVWDQSGENGADQTTNGTDQITNATAAPWLLESSDEEITYQQLTDPNFLFTRCCSERSLSDACVAKCSHDAFTETTIQFMYLNLDGCPISVAPELQFCAAQGRDHTECCRSRGVHRTAAGDKCLALCDQRNENFTPLDLSLTPCGEKFEEMKSCFYDGVKAAAEQAFFTRRK